MTEGQIRYQTILENQRHNLEMERIGQKELEVSKRNVAVKESEEARALALMPQQKVLMNAQAQSNLIKVWEGAANTVNTAIKAARGLFGLFGDAMNFASSVEGMSGGGYYQGSLFA